MPQHDYALENADGATFRADLNQALAAIASLNSGPAEPVPSFAYQLWHDTTTGVLRQRNAGNTAWVTLLSSLGGATAASVTALSNSLAAAQTARAWVNFNGTGTVAIRASHNVASITDNGVGDYTVNFTNALIDANYAVCATPSAGSANSVQAYVNTLTAPSASAVRIYTIAGINTTNDPAFVNVAIFR